MPLTAYGRPLHIRPLSDAIHLPRQQQAAPPTLAGWGRQGVPMTDTLAKPTANFTSARPPQGVPLVSAWTNMNAPQIRGVTTGGPDLRQAVPTKGTTITGTPTAQRIPVSHGDPTVVRSPAGPHRPPTLTPRNAQLTDPGVATPGPRPTVTEATPGYTPRAKTKVIDLVQSGSVWSPGVGYQPSSTPTAPTTAGGTPATTLALAPTTPTATGYAPPQTAGADQTSAGASTGASGGPPAGDTSSPPVGPATSAGRPWWQYALGAAIVGGIVYAATR